MVSGPAGQGKTALAEEAGRRLPRSGIFSRVCIVRYASFQERDPVNLAVGTIGAMLGESLLDAAVLTEALNRTPTLVILDGLEALDSEILHELLSAAAAWSEAGRSRVLITTRSRNLHHPGYRRRMPSIAISSCEALPLTMPSMSEKLMRLPAEPRAPLPTRESLRNLFAEVDFHPLSVARSLFC